MGCHRRRIADRVVFELVVFAPVHAIALDFGVVAVDGRITKSPCGGHKARPIAAPTTHPSSR